MNKIRWISFIIAIIGVVLCSAGDIKQMDFSSKYAVGNLLIFLQLWVMHITMSGSKIFQKDILKWKWSFLLT
jgi:hypothetical protein